MKAMAIQDHPSKIYGEKDKFYGTYQQKIIKSNTSIVSFIFNLFPIAILNGKLIPVYVFLIWESIW